MILPESSNFEILITYFNFVAWITYAATFVSLMWLRHKRPELKRPYKVCAASYPEIFIFIIHQIAPKHSSFE